MEFLLSITSSRVATCEDAEIVSGSYADNTLSLMKQGGGSVDIPFEGLASIYRYNPLKTITGTIQQRSLSGSTSSGFGITSSGVRMCMSNEDHICMGTNENEWWTINATYQPNGTSYPESTTLYDLFKDTLDDAYDTIGQFYYYFAVGRYPSIYGHFIESCRGFFNSKDESDSSSTLPEYVGTSLSNGSYFNRAGIFIEPILHSS